MTQIEYVKPDIPASLLVVPRAPVVTEWKTEKDVGFYIIDLQTQFNICTGRLTELNNILDAEIE